MSNSKMVNISLKSQKVTKNTVRFEELVEPNQAEKVGYIYIKKETLANLDIPFDTGMINVTIAKRDDN